MHVVTNYLNITSLLLLLLAGLIGYIVVLAVVKKERLSHAKEALEIEERLGTALRMKCDVLEADIRVLKDTTNLQEKRILRAELEASRKDRLLMYARQEVEIMQEVVALLVSVLQELSPDVKTRAESLLRRLSEFRVKAATERLRWEDDLEAKSVYLSEEIYPGHH